MTEKFTKGSWRRAFNRSRSGNGNVRGRSHCRIENENGVVIAFTVPQSSKQEQVANTNLIATAPGMYDELEKLERVFRSLVRECVPGSGKAYLLWKCIDEILELRKKARGEE